MASQQESHQSPYFIGIVKDIAPSIPTLKLFISLILKKFPGAKFIIYENNSTDGTPDLLQGLDSSAVRIISERIDPSTLLDSCKARTWDNKPCRMEAIAAARNRLLDFFWESSPADDALVVIMDFDINKIPSMGPLFKYLENFPSDADAIFANGVSAKSPTYYDMYALRTVSAPIGPEISGEAFWQGIKYMSIPQDGALIPVISAFGGIGIYRVASIRGARYSGIVTSALDAFYRAIFTMDASIRKKYEHGAIKVKDGVLHGIKLYGDILYQNNSGYNFPVICEHSAFHADMALTGHNRLFIASDLIYTSTH